MKAEWVALCTVCVALCARAGAWWPQCRPAAACAAGPPAAGPGHWTTRNYVVDGKRLSVAMSGSAVRWDCARGVDPAGAAAPRFPDPYLARRVELVDCAICPEASYSSLLKNLLQYQYPRNITLALTSTRMRNGRWLSKDELKQIKVQNVNYRNFTDDQAAKNGVQHLYLRGITMTDEQLASAQGVETLTLVQTGLKTVMNLSYFKYLRRLELHERELVDASQLASAPALRELVLRAPDAGLVSMPLLRNVTFLDVYTTGSLFGNCRNLQELTLEGGELETLHEHWLAECGELRKLRLTRLLYLHALPRSLLAGAVALETLDLSRNGLQLVAVDLLAHAANLTRLDLSHNALRTLPGGLLAGAPALATLDLSHNALRILPGGLLAGAPALATLDLSHNALRTLPGGLLAGAPALATLDLSHNALQTLPDGLLAGAPTLTRLDLSHNVLQTVPDGLLAGAPALSRLDLSHNALQTVPDGLLAGAPALTRLDLTHNALRTLPGGLLAGAPALATLHLSHNQLLALPPGFLDVTHSPPLFVYMCDTGPYVMAEENAITVVERDYCPN